MPNATDAIVPGGQQLLLDLAAQLQTVSQALVSAQKDSAEAKAISREAKAENASLRVQLDSQSEKRLGGFKFRHIGNELNYTSNLDAITVVCRATVAFQSGKTDELEKLHKDLIALLKNQNKLIKWADGSPAGWGLIVEYLGTGASDDVEDDRRYKKAEQSCELKFKRKQEADTKRNNPRKSARFSEEGSWDGEDGDRSQNTKTTTHSHGTRYNSEQKQLMGPCFFCRGPHVRKYCPELAKETAEVQAKIEAVIKASRL